MFPSQPKCERHNAPAHNCGGQDQPKGVAGCSPPNDPGECGKSGRACGRAYRFQACLLSAPYIPMHSRFLLVLPSVTFNHADAAWEDTRKCKKYSTYVGPQWRSTSDATTVTVPPNKKRETYSCHFVRESTDVSTVIRPIATFPTRPPSRLRQ